MAPGNGRLGRRSPILSAGATLGLSAAPRAGATQPATLVIWAEADVPPLDPHRIVGTIGLRIIDALLEPLIREDLDHPTRVATDDAVRTQCYRQAAELIAADAPWISLYQDPLPRVARKHFRGIQPAPSMYFDYPALAVG